MLPRNPFITSIYTADPTARTWDGEKLYVYASHDIDPPRGCDLMDRYHVFSTTDMVNWTDEGEILNSGDSKWGRAEGGFMWAPDCVFRNGTYYFYYPHPSGTAWNDTWKIGVAASKYPDREFTDQGYIKGLGGFALIDPCVLIDDDGQAYIYIGGGHRCQGAMLNEDMLTLKTEPKDMEGLYDFHEAAWVFKRNGKYYMSYSDNAKPENYMRYAVSDNPLGPWTHKGAYLPPVGCETTHGSVVEFKGQWYQFYHNQAISGRGAIRSVCVDKLYFDGNGDILPVKQTADGVVSYQIPNGAVTYAADGFETSGGAVLKDGVITGLQKEGAAFKLTGADGKGGGRATVWVRYSYDGEHARLRLTVNGRDESFINILPYTDAARLTVALEPGARNEIILAGDGGDVEVKEIIVSYFPL